MTRLRCIGSRVAVALNHNGAAADTDYVARSHSRTIGAGRPTPPPPGAGGTALALTILGATALLATPMALWARFGDDNIVRTISIATASIMLSAGLVYFVRRPRYAGYGPDLPVPAVAAPACSCRPEVRRAKALSRAAPRMRVGGPASTHRARPPRPTRPARDVRCRSAALRTARRRSRP